MESGGVMQDPITTTSSDSGSSHAFHKWKQKVSGDSTQIISFASRAFFARIPNLDFLFLS
uniref:Uncharacterized protein MANES_15G122400 n=1 Tax=Rhizophora mucronata TaxID=61149 RepID=A0A2P2JSX0_RHIMU